MDDPDLCPWPDFAGNPIRHGARMWHPISGQTFTAVRLLEYPDPGDAWRAIYDDDPQSVSRLGLQIGDKGQAVVVNAQRHAPIFYTVFCGDYQGAPLALPGYSHQYESGVLDLVLAGARREGFKGTVQRRMKALGWRVGAVFA